MVVGDLIGEGSAQDQSVVGETPNLAAWPPPRDRAYGARESARRTHGLRSATRTATTSISTPLVFR
jgi:hypothetical protein